MLCLQIWKTLNQLYESTFMITCIKSAHLKMYINAGSVSSSLKSKHRIFFYTLILNVINIPASYIILFLGIPALVDYTKMSAECTTKRKSSTYWGYKYRWFPLLRRRGEYTILSSMPFLEPLGSYIFTGKPQNNFSWSLISASLLRF